MSTLKLEEVGRRRASYVSPAAQVFHVLALLERFLLRYFDSWGILHALLKRLLLRIWYVLLKISLLRYLMCSLKSIIAEVFENISMRYLMCSLDIIGLVSIIISSNCLFSSLCCGEILSWSSQQVVYRWLGKPAIFQELFQRWLRWLATFQPLFSSQILQNRFLVIKLFKSLILQRRLNEIEMV